MSDNTGQEVLVVVEETLRSWRCGECFVEARRGGGFGIGYPDFVIRTEDLRPIARALLAAADAVDPQDGGAE